MLSIAGTLRLWSRFAPSSQICSPELQDPHLTCHCCGPISGSISSESGAYLSSVGLHQLPHLLALQPSRLVPDFGPPSHTGLNLAIGLTRPQFSCFMDQEEPSLSRILKFCIYSCGGFFGVRDKIYIKLTIVTIFKGPALCY